jgi:hypothetical protein
MAEFPGRFPIGTARLRLPPGSGPARGLRLSIHAPDCGVTRRSLTFRRCPFPVRHAGKQIVVRSCGAALLHVRRRDTPAQDGQVSQHPTPASRHQVNHAKRIRPPFLRVQASGGQECLRRLRSAAVRHGREMAKAGHLSQRAPAGGATAPAVGQRPKCIPAAVATAAMMARTDDGCLARLPTALMGANPPSGRTGTNGRHTKEADASRCAALR